MWGEQKEVTVKAFAEVAVCNLEPWADPGDPAIQSWAEPEITTSRTAIFFSCTLRMVVRVT